jgi:hypothetical protein
MPPAKSGGGRKLLDAAYYKELKEYGGVKDNRKVDFDASLVELGQWEERGANLRRKLDEWFSKIDKDASTSEAAINIRRMFQRSTGCEETFWSVQCELAHRLEFLKMAQEPLENRMLFTEDVPDKPFDSNLDRLMDFVKAEGETSLLGFSAVQLAARCNKDRWDTNYFDPDKIWTYLSTYGGSNRRTRWDIGHNSDRKRDRPNGQPGRSRYSSNNLCVSDKNTQSYGRYDKNTGEFVPWRGVDVAAMYPFKGCVRTLVELEQVAYESKSLRDRLKYMTKGQTKRGPVEKRLNAHSYQPKAKAVKAAKELVLEHPTGAEGGVKYNRCAVQNIQRFESEWGTLVRLAQSWRFPGCLNTVWTLVRMLSATGCMVFSMPGSVYKPALGHHRRLDDNVSYADPELTKLILEDGLTDEHFTGIRAVNGACCRVFSNAKMKREGGEYILKPFAFIFDCETAMLRLTSATDFLNTDVKLFIRVRNILSQVTRGCGFDLPEEMRKRMNNPTDMFFGNHELHPLMKLEINFELLGSKRIHRRATLQELHDESFPSLYKTIIFASKQIEGGPFVIHNGATFYAKYPDRDWVLVEPVGNEIVLHYVDEG